MRLHTHLWQLGLYTEIRDSITHALLMACPILEQGSQHLRVLHPIAGLTLLELQEGEPSRASNPLFNQPKLSHLVKNFPLRITHGAFSLPPVGVVNEMRLTTLLEQVPSFFDQYEVGHAGQVRVIEFKCKERGSKMPMNIYKMGLALGVSRTWRDTLLEQLIGTREEPEAFELTTPEEPMAKPSIKSRLLSNLVA
jgi:hypothetical protein